MTQSSASVGKPIATIASELGVAPTAVYQYGPDKAKIDLAYLEGLFSDSDSAALATLDGDATPVPVPTSVPAQAPLSGQVPVPVAVPAQAPGKLVLVTAISPTPAGEGKTTTSIGLADGLRRIGTKSVLALREPSMGPVFGIKGGATGGGKATLIPETDINLHFTGDFAAIAEANNLLAAMVDNALHFNTVEIDPRTVTIRRALDVNDRALRSVVVGLGGRTGGVPRESGFDITAASQIMATFCMATSLADLNARLARIVVGQDFSGEPVTVKDLEADGALTAVLKDALAPNLVQTAEGTPAFVHGGPFANIAHGTNSVIATKAALVFGEVAVTEAGFGADLGAEKYFDIVARQSGITPDVTVIVATVRALKYHGGMALADIAIPDVARLEAGLPNLERHVENLREVFGQQVIVAINQFAQDSPEEIAAIEAAMERFGAKVVLSNHFGQGGAGAENLARAVVESLQYPSETTFAYPDDAPLKEKAVAVVRRVYGGSTVSFTPAAARELERLQNAGWANAPICVAKTQYSFSTNPKELGAPEGFDVNIREVRLSAGAGFIVLISGSIMTMPGLPKRPSACDIAVAPDGTVTGMH